MITIGFMGFGYWGPNILRTLHNCSGVSIRLACDVSDSNCKRMKESYPDLSVTTNPEQLFSDSDIQALFIATPADTHYELSRRALENEKHVFVEKPLATSSKEAKELSQIASRHNKILMVGHIFTYHPAIECIKQAIDSDTLGTLQYGYVQRTSLGPRVRDDVNVIWDYAIHDIYVAMHLFGGKPVSISSEGKAALQPGIEDVVYISMDFESGMKYHIHSSWYDPEKIRKMTIVGSRRMMTYDDMKDEKVVLFDRGYAPHEGFDSFGNKNLRLYDDGAQIQTLPDHQPLQMEIEHFIDCIENGKNVLTDGNVGSWTLEVIEAANKSLQLGRKISL